MKNEPFEIVVGDRLKTYTGVCEAKNDSGVIAAQNLTGFSVTFTMINAATGVAKVSSASATIITAASGLAGYSFSAVDVDTPGIYWATFKATSGGLVGSFPVRPGDGVIWIHGSDGTTAQEVFDAAVAG